MLRIWRSKSPWIASALAALAVLAVGVGVAASYDQSPTFGPHATIELVQGDEPPPPDPCSPTNPACCTDPSCSVEDGEEGETTPEGPGGPGGGGGGGACYFNTGGNDDGTVTVADRAGDSVEMVLVAQTGRVEIPCNHPAYGFYADGCFWGDPPALAQPPDAPPDGETEDSGAWYWGSCIASVVGELPNQDYNFFAVIRWQWFGADEVPTVTPEQVAQDWLAQVDLFGVDFELAPPETGAGLVTLPVWLGVAETADTWGPIEDEHCLGGVCVSITAQVSEVEWTMGDGASFTCTREQHVVWDSSMNYLAPGGNCHHVYDQDSRDQPDGKYQITAVSTWTVDWSSTDDAGQLSTTREAEAFLQINQIQVLTR
jgi:hypothetical protein